MKKYLIFLFLALILTVPSHARQMLFQLNDPIGDDYGPGSFVYPKNQVFSPGSFDLTGFAVSDDGDSVIFRVYLKNRFTSPPDLQISNNKNLKDLFGTKLYLQNIDIYIDKDHKLNSGSVNAIPGRNVKIAAGSAWEQAIFIAPQPFLARSETKRLAKEIADRIIIPIDYEVSGDYIEAKVSKKIIGQPDKRWGYLVLLTGAEWESSAFSLSNWMMYGPSYEEPDLNRIVDKYASEWEFGGGDNSGAVPNVIDMLVASDETQEKLLSDYDPLTKRRAALPAVYPFNSTLEAETAGTAESSSSNEFMVIDEVANVVTINAGKDSGLTVGKLGQVFDGSGNQVATILVEEVKSIASICTIVPLTQRGEIAAGMKVRFK